MRHIHWSDNRLRVNAGMNFPACHVTEGPLDLDKARLAQTRDVREVTCPHCLVLVPYRKAQDGDGGAQ